MRKLAVLLLMLGGITAAQLPAQDPVSAPSPVTKEEKKSPREKNEKSASPGEDKSGMNKLLGNSPQGGEPTTTEIYADEAFFDSNKSTGIFSGHVKVTDPRFNLQSDKLTVFISKGENQGLEKAVAEGNVGVVRDRPDPNGGPPTRAVGRSDKAVYVAASGDVELTGTPRVQQGLNTHIATSPDTVMVINQNGQLKTHGPSRTEIRQEPKDEKDQGKSEGKGENKGDAKSPAKPSDKPEKAQGSPKKR
jgi:lipopolysaccharide transport protein LptA